jgi:hypothetical protein
MIKYMLRVFVNVGGLYLTSQCFEAGEAPVPVLGPAFLSQKGSDFLEFGPRFLSGYSQKP